MTNQPRVDREVKLRELLHGIAAGDATVERSRELETLIATEFAYDPRLDDLEVALALFSPMSGPGLIDAAGLAKVSQQTLADIERSVSGS